MSETASVTAHFARRNAQIDLIEAQNERDYWKRKADRPFYESPIFVAAAAVVATLALSFAAVEIVKTER